MVYASKLVKPRGRFAGSHEPWFYLGADSVDELHRFINQHNLQWYSIGLVQPTTRYILLPKWLMSKIVRLGLEVVKVSEFDRRTCSSGGGIPSVETQGQLSGIGEGENHESHE